jgi:hypothetical protein
VRIVSPPGLCAKVGQIGQQVHPFIVRHAKPAPKPPSKGA